MTEGTAGAAGAGLVLVVNAGSSSLKLSLLDPAGAVTASAGLDRWDGSAGTAGLRGFLAGQRRHRRGRGTGWSTAAAGSPPPRSSTTRSSGAWPA